MAKDPETLRELREILEANVDIMRIYEARAVRAEARLKLAEAVCEAHRAWRDSLVDACDQQALLWETGNALDAYLAGKEKDDGEEKDKEDAT